jgi:hypothetical protein
MVEIHIPAAMRPLPHNLDSRRPANAPSIFFATMSRTRNQLRLRDESADRAPGRAITNVNNQGEESVKYILMMSSTQSGVATYHTWSQRDRDTHMQTLGAIAKELVETGEFVSTQPLADPKEAKLVRGEKNGLPVTDGVFPEAKEFLLGFWIVNVATAERAYAIAGRISAAPGPGGIPTNMAIEVRQFVEPATVSN